MKFKTSDLITRIDNLLRDLQGKAIDRAEKLDEETTLSADAWYDDHRDGYRELVVNIRRQLDQGKVITTDVIPTSIKGRSNTELKFYFAPSKGRPMAEERRADNLLKLKSALQASTEDTISPTAIKQLGFQDVTFLFTPEAAA